MVRGALCGAGATILLHHLPGEPMSAIAKDMKPSPGTGATARLAKHVASTRYENLGPNVIHAFKRAFQDHLTCAIAGSAMPVSRALLDYYQQNDATRVATAIGSGAKLS